MLDSDRGDSQARRLITAIGMYLSDFDTDYIGPDSKKRTDKVFVSVVCKMQKLLGSTLSTAEKRGIAKWLP